MLIIIITDFELYLLHIPHYVKAHYAHKAVHTTYNLYG
jgi:hypothetical protein